MLGAKITPTYRGDTLHVRHLSIFASTCLDRGCFRLWLSYSFLYSINMPSNVETTLTEAIAQLEKESQLRKVCVV